MWFIKNIIDEKWAYYNDIFSKEECDKIIKYGETLNLNTALTESTDNVNSNNRKSLVSRIKADNEDNRWIYERCCYYVDIINQRYFNFDLTFIEDLQFTVYKSNGGFYGPHTDALTNSGASRKLSFSILLNSPEEYQGGELVFHYQKNGVNAPQKTGIGVFFPSYTLHEVNPVTSGTRYALVGWCVGPQFR